MTQARDKYCIDSFNDSDDLLIGFKQIINNRYAKDVWYGEYNYCGF